MSYFLEEYLSRGFANIFTVHYETHEESGGFQNEYTSESVVAERNGKFFRLEAQEKRKYGPRPKVRQSVTEHEIGSPEYQRLAAEGRRLDTPEARRRLEDEKKRQTLCDDLGSQLDASAPDCPVHKTKMRRKVGQNGPFWGCPEFPDCRRTRSFSEEQSKKYEEYRSMLFPTSAR